jgi:hypothetical protein
MTQKPETRTPSHALEVVRDDHRRMQDLLDECARAEPSAKRVIADNLVAEAQCHVLVAQEFLGPVLARVTHDSTSADELANHARAIDSLAEEMAEVRGEDPRFAEVHDRMQKELSGHVEAEERNVFPYLERVGNEELVAIGQKMLARKEEALRDLSDETPRKPQGPGGDDI